MQSALLEKGVPASRIDLDYAGLRTLDSVVRAKEVFGQDRITIISQKFHNQRAIFLASHCGIDAIGFNAPEVALQNSQDPPAGAICQSEGSTRRLFFSDT